MGNEDWEGSYKWRFLMPVLFVLIMALPYFGQMYPLELQKVCFAFLAVGLSSLIFTILCHFYSIIELVRAIKRSILRQGKKAVDDDDPYHAVIIPNLNEEKFVISETLDHLAIHTMARKKIIIWLGMEDREGNSAEKAKSIIESYPNTFYYLSYSVHRVKPGEGQNKASNINFCIAELETTLRELRINPKNVMTTIINADSWVPREYFHEINDKIQEKPHLLHEFFFFPPSMTARNDDCIPMINRNLDNIWNSNFYLNMYSPFFRFPISHWTMSLEMLKQVGYFDTCEDALSDDLHIGVKISWKRKNKVYKIPIIAPFNVLSNATGRGYCQDLKARFWQLERHMRSMNEVSYCLNLLFSEPFRLRSLYITLCMISVHLNGLIIAVSVFSLDQLYRDRSNHQHLLSRNQFQILMSFSMVFCIFPFLFYQVSKWIACKYMYRNLKSPTTFRKLLQFPLISLFGYLYMLLVQVLTAFRLLWTPNVFRVSQKYCQMASHDLSTQKIVRAIEEETEEEHQTLAL